MRSATLADVDALVPLCEALHAEGAYRELRFEHDRVRHTLTHAIAHAPHRCVLVAQRDEELVGLLAGHLETYLCSSERFACDTAFYVRPSRRNGVAARALVAAFRRWADERGARELCMGVSSGIHPERTGRFLGTLGLVPAGSLFKQRLR